VEIEVSSDVHLQRVTLLSMADEKIYIYTAFDKQTADGKIDPGSRDFSIGVFSPSIVGF